MLLPYVDDIMMIGSDEGEVATPLDTFVRHSHARGWEANPTHNNSGACHLTESSWGPVI